MSVPGDKVQAIFDEVSRSMDGQPADKVAVELRRRLAAIGLKGVDTDPQIDRIARGISDNR